MHYVSDPLNRGCKTPYVDGRPLKAGERACGYKWACDLRIPSIRLRIGYYTKYCLRVCERDKTPTLSSSETVLALHQVLSSLTRSYMLACSSSSHPSLPDDLLLSCASLDFTVFTPGGPRPPDCHTWNDCPRLCVAYWVDGPKLCGVLAATHPSSTLLCQRNSMSWVRTFGSPFFSSSPSPSLAPSSSCSPELADGPLSLCLVVLTCGFVCALSVLVCADAGVAVGLVLIVLCCGGCIFIIYRRWKFIRDKKVSHHPHNKISILAQGKTSNSGA